MRLIIAFATLCVAGPAAAQLSTLLTWDNPATYSDGTALDPADIVSHRVEWTGRCPGFEYVAPQNSLVVEGSAESMLVEVTPGYRCFRAFVTARFPGCTVTDTDNCLREGPASNVWGRQFEAEPVIVPAKTPNAPTGLSGN